MHAARERLDVKGLGELAVDPVLDLAQQPEVAQPLVLRQLVPHGPDRAMRGHEVVREIRSAPLIRIWSRSQYS